MIHKRLGAVFSLIIFFVISLWIPPTTLGEGRSNFVSMKLPRGIELQIPRGWWLLGADENRLIDTSVEAAIDLSGIGTPEGKRVNLIAAHSMPKSTYAAVRVSSTIPPSATPAELSSMAPRDIKEIQLEIQKMLKKLLPLQGCELIKFFGSRIEKISGYPAIVTEYRRSGPKGPVLVQASQIFTPSQEIQINLSYRESETGLWKPVIGKIQKSIVVTNWSNKR